MTWTTWDSFFIKIHLCLSYLSYSLFHISCKHMLIAVLYFQHIVIIYYLAVTLNIYGKNLCCVWIHFPYHFNFIDMPYDILLQVIIFIWSENLEVHCVYSDVNLLTEIGVTQQKTWIGIFVTIKKTTLLSKCFFL